MTKKIPTLSISIAIITSILGFMVGYYLTPEYRLSMYDREYMDLGRADKWVDLRYINGMISHHRGAMLLAEQAQKESPNEEITKLAEVILKEEPKAIEELYQWKKDWYKDTKKVKDPSVYNLGTKDEKFDLRFLNAMIEHHENGLVMTEEIKQKSKRNEILNNASDVETFLNTTLDIFKGWRKDWYNI